jgi:hypothetical protein
MRHPHFEILDEIKLLMHINILQNKIDDACSREKMMYASPLRDVDKKKELPNGNSLYNLEK